LGVDDDDDVLDADAEAEMMAEYVAIFGETMSKDVARAVVCSACYHKFMAWWDATRDGSVNGSGNATGTSNPSDDDDEDRSFELN
jgi:hypothetical protein